jgi:hypothetical protein
MGTPEEAAVQHDNTRTVGIAWYERNDYVEARRLMTDAPSLPVDYDTWLRNAELVVLLEEARGSDVIRAPIHSASFAAWCSATGQRPDVDARTRHVNLAVDDHCTTVRALRAFESTDQDFEEEPTL